MEKNQAFMFKLTSILLFFSRFSHTDDMLDVLNFKQFRVHKNEYILVEKSQSPYDRRIFFLARQMKKRDIFSQTRVSATGITLVKKDGGSFKQVSTLEDLNKCSDGRLRDFE